MRLTFAKEMSYYLPVIQREKKRKETIQQNSAHPKQTKPWRHNEFNVVGEAVSKGMSLDISYRKKRKTIQCNQILLQLLGHRKWGYVKVGWLQPFISSLVMNDGWHMIAAARGVSPFSRLTRILLPQQNPAPPMGLWPMAWIFLRTSLASAIAFRCDDHHHRYKDFRLS